MHITSALNGSSSSPSSQPCYEFNKSVGYESGICAYASFWGEQQHLEAAKSTVSLMATVGKVATPAFTTGRQEPNLLTDTHTHTLPSISCGFLLSCLSSKALPCSSRLFYFVSQTSAARFLSVWRGKEVEWKKGSNRPLWPHGAGRRAVGQEPAGLSRAYLWSAFSSLPSEELRAPALTSASPPIPSSAPPLLALLVSRTVRPPPTPSKKIKIKNKRARCTLSALIFPLLLLQSLLSQTIYTGGVHT